MTKVISLSEEAYSRLKLMKLENESFSDTVNRLCARKGSLLDIVDMYPELRDLDEFEEALSTSERAAKQRMETTTRELS